jgi:uncharacterized protein (DUF433 family)
MNKADGDIRPEYKREDLGRGEHGRYLRAPLLERDPEVMSGALCFAGTRVPVKHLFDYLEGSSSLDDFLQDFPSVSREHAVAVLEAAHQCLAADASAAFAPANR